MIKKIIPILEKAIKYIAIAVALQGIIKVALETCKAIDNGSINGDNSAIPTEA